MSSWLAHNTLHAPPPAENNGPLCAYDGGDCCEYSCISGKFSCGVVGYSCREEEEIEDEDDSNLGTGTWVGIIIVLLLIARSICVIAYDTCKDEEHGSNRRGGLKIVAWVFLAIQFMTNVFAYRGGGGRVVKYVDGECIEGEGPPLVAVATLVRTVIVVISQCCVREGLLPEEVVMTLFSACWSTQFNMVKYDDDEAPGGWRLLICLPFYVIYYFIKWVVALPLLAAFNAVPFIVYSFCPVLADASAVCLIWDEIPRVWVIVGLVGFYVLFWLGMLVGYFLDDSTTDLGGDEDDGDQTKRKSALGAMDSLVTDVFSTWANVVQSGYLLGFSFALLPTFELGYYIAETFFGLNAS